MMHHIRSVSTLKEIKDFLSSIEENSIIFLDVDDTLITPISKVFRFRSPYRTLIDDIKRDRERIPHFETLLSRWRLQRQTQLVSEEWVGFIKELKEKFPLYALTQMETGPLGDIPLMEKWRHKELTEKGLEFTLTYCGQNKEVILSSPSKPYDATFYKGIFSTGSYSKGEIIRQYCLRKNPGKVVLIDDRAEHLNDVYNACCDCSVPFSGIFFKGERLIAGVPDTTVAEFQKDHLLSQYEWLEDEEAERKIREGSGFFSLK
ncbi:MAG TPA: hypothetical protein DER04_06960 [Holosporales bacterium]|nr:hypothetical protein [Holosporales bacterium]HCC24780.1 hypothetical protein [Holosporales bacterium]HCE96488.1 hypothetical protein [Holosporales bacterium]